MQMDEERRKIDEERQKRTIAEKEAMAAKELLAQVESQFLAVKTRKEKLEAELMEAAEYVMQQQIEQEALKVSYQYSVKKAFCILLTALTSSHLPI